MSSQPLGTPDMTVPAQYSHFLQMWEFLENTSGLQDGDFIVVQAPGVGSKKKGSGDGCKVPGTAQTPSSNPVAARCLLQKGRQRERRDSYSSAVDCGMRSGILVSFRLEHSTTPDSQRHFGGQMTSLLHSLFSW